MQKTRSLLTVSLLCALPILCAAQTYIGPSIGIDISQIEGAETSQRISTISTRSGYPHKTLTAGLTIQQQLPQHIFLLGQMHLGHRTVPYIDIGVVGYTHLRYWQLSSALRANYLLHEHWYAGAGIGYHQHYKLEVGKDDFTVTDTWSEESRIHRLGWSISAGYTYKRLLIDVAFTRMKNTLNGMDGLFKPFGESSTFEVSLRYLFRVPF